MPTIIINAISNHVSIAAIRNRSTVNCILLISTNSAIPTLKAIINAGMAATVKSNMPSPIKRRKNAATTGSHCHTQCHFTATMLRTEPECTNHSQEDIQHQEEQDAKLCLHFVHIFKFADMTNIAERRCLQQKDVTYPIQAVGICHKCIYKVFVCIRRNTETHLDVAHVTQLIYQLISIQIIPDKRPTPFVRCFKMRTAHRNGNWQQYDDDTHDRDKSEPLHDSIADVHRVNQVPDNPQ